MKPNIDFIVTVSFLLCEFTNKNLKSKKEFKYSSYYSKKKSICLYNNSLSIKIPVCHHTTYAPTC